MKKVVVVGSSNVDTVIRVPHIPAEGETLLARSVEICFGGKGANQAAAVAKLGGNVSVIACVGQDSFGQALVSNLADCGVDTGGVEQLAKAQSGAAYIYVADQGENNIVVNAGANNCLSRELVGRCRHLFEGAELCITQLETPLDTLYFVASLCRELDVRLILNPAPAAELDFEQLRGTWMIVPNEGELGLLVPGEGDVATKARALHQKGFEHVLVTLGPQGCLHLHGASKQAYPACHALAVKDTTAAGDSFIGALAFGLTKGLALGQAIELANKAASVTVSRAGAQPSLPTLAEVEEAYGPI